MKNLKKNEYYLEATTQKSYYKKAKVRVENNLIILTSYQTDVVAIDRESDKIIRLWNGWSFTTSNHINDFLTQRGFKKLSKKEWLALPCVNNDDVYSIYTSNGFYTHKSTSLLTEIEAIKEVDRLSMFNGIYTSTWYE